MDPVFRYANGVWIEGIQVDNNSVSSMTWFNGRIDQYGRRYNINVNYSF